MLDQKTFKDYLTIKQIGSTITGESFLVQHRFTKEFFLLKVLPKPLTEVEDFLSRFEVMAQTLAKCEHPHLLALQNISCEEGVYFIVSKFKEEMMSLKEYLEQKLLSEEANYTLLHQLASVCDYLHAQGIDFCGLHLDHLYVDQESNLYVSDVALAACLGCQTMVLKTMQMVLDSYQENQEGALFAKQFMDHYPFFAPELKKENQVKFADIFAYGICAYYVLTRTFPEGNFTKPSQFLEEQNYRWDWLIEETLHYDHTKRPVLLVEAIEQIKTPTYIESLREQENKEQPTAVQQMSYASVKMTHVEKKNIADATPLPINPDDDDAYEKIGQMLERTPVVKEYQPQEKTVSASDPLLTEMLFVQGGKYSRGCWGGKRDEMPEHEVYLNDFMLDLHPVTNEQFVRFLEVLGGEKDEHYNDVIRLKESRINRSGGRFFIETGYGNHPVVGVTWYGASGYAAWIGKRLPTEAEWEVACKSGMNPMLYPTGAMIQRQEANFFNSDTTQVCSYPPNHLGLYDMVGNVYEWCHDWYSYNYYEVSAQEPYCPKGPSQGVYRVLRGGCWKSSKEDLRCCHRHRNNPGSTNSTYGFRCAKDAEEN